MTDLYLHIGMSKTGSTSIQGAFHAARAELVAHGFDYLDMGQNHSRILKIAAKGKGKRLKGAVADQLGLGRNVGGYDVGRVVDALTEKLASPKARRMVMSGEGLFRVEQKEADGLAALFGRHFDRVRIVAYVRDPVTWASSRAQENIKHGHTVAELEATVATPDESPIVPNYRRSLERYIERFGREAIDIRVFDRRRMVDGDLIADFAAAIGAGPEVARILPRPWNNPRTSHEALILVERHYAALRQRWGDLAGAAGFKDYDYVSLEYWFRRALRDLPGTAFSLPRATLEAIWRASEADVAWLRAETGDPTLFDDAWPPKGPDGPAWSAETAAALALMLEDSIGRRRRSELLLWLRRARERKFSGLLTGLVRALLR